MEVISGEGGIQRVAPSTPTHRSGNIWFEIITTQSPMSRCILPLEAEGGPTVFQLLHHMFDKLKKLQVNISRPFIFSKKKIYKIAHLVHQISFRCIELY